VQPLYRPEQAHEWKLDAVFAPAREVLAFGNASAERRVITRR
jgi:hypothetical protein